jgi:hypothetical protein
VQGYNGVERVGVYGVDGVVVWLSEVYGADGSRLWSGWGGGCLVNLVQGMVGVACRWCISMLGVG